MTPFEYYFSFFTLIIGLAVADVARGFGKLWQNSQKVRVGVLTPLLAAFLLLDMSRFWLALWSHEAIAALGAVALASVLIIALPYVFVATVMFPADPAQWESLDEHYLAHSRPMFIALLVSKIAAYVFDAILFDSAMTLGELPAVILMLCPLVLLIASRKTIVHRVGLILLVAWSALVFVISA